MRGDIMFYAANVQHNVQSSMEESVQRAQEGDCSHQSMHVAMHHQSLMKNQQFILEGSCIAATRHCNTIHHRHHRVNPVLCGSMALMLSITQC